MVRELEDNESGNFEMVVSDDLQTSCLTVWFSYHCNAGKGEMLGSGGRVAHGPDRMNPVGSCNESCTSLETLARCRKPLCYKEHFTYLECIMKSNTSDLEIKHFLRNLLK